MTAFFPPPKVKLSATTQQLNYNNKNTQVRVIFLSKRLVSLSSAGAGYVRIRRIYLFVSSASGNGRRCLTFRRRKQLFFTCTRRRLVPSDSEKIDIHPAALHRRRSRASRRNLAQ